jgi:autotransporter-associated beta strand protein
VGHFQRRISVGSNDANFENDRHVGNGKYVNINMALRGDDAPNYKLSDLKYRRNVGVINQLDSVQWVGANEGVWSNPNNWMGGAIPDGDNVANIVIPTGRLTVYDSSGFGVSSSAINNQGTIRFIGTQDVDFNNNVSGSGRIEQRGTGELTISGNNTMSGSLDIGSGKVTLGHNNALGLSTVMSSGGLIAQASGVVLSDLTVDGAITTRTAIVTTGNQTYFGALTFESDGQRTPGPNDADPRAANFESLQGDLRFMHTVNSDGQDLVVSAINGDVTFNDEVGVSFVGLTPAFDLKSWDALLGYKTIIDGNLNPRGVDVLANKIYINANIATKGPQRYQGESIIGSNDRNSKDRILLSMNPSITFDGPINDSTGEHNLILRAISTADGQTPTITHGDVGQRVALRSFDAQVGDQDPHDKVAVIIDDRFRYKGEITIGGSVNVVGDIIYKAGDVTLDATSPVILRSDLGSVSIQTKLTQTAEQPVPNPIAIGQGQSLAVSIGHRGGRFVNETGTPSGSIAFRKDPPPVTSEQAGSGMVSALKRAIERIQIRQPDLDEFLDLTANAVAGGEVSIGSLQDASSTTLSGSASSGATQIDCSNQTVAQANQEQCRSTNQD